MKERTLKQKVKVFYERNGFKVWFPIRNRWQKIDIFGVFDGIAWKEDLFVFFQMTTQENKSTRFKKIKEYMTENNLSFVAGYTRGEVICWDANKRLLRVYSL